VRLVALGASNLTRGFPTVVSTARAAWGRDVEILAALGHGRSYGARSRVAFRALPGILESGLWSELASRPAAATRALVTDVGNDILYGFSAAQVLDWVEEALERLARVTTEIAVTGLPLASIRRLSNRKFLVFRTVLVPSCRLSLGQVVERSEVVSAGLARLAGEREARFVAADPAWYGFDPVHVRRAMWRSAWPHVLGAPPATQATPAPRSSVEGLRLYLMAPERRWIFGREQVTPQAGRALREGGRVWLF
jgi:hypothetical protein